MLYYDKDHVKIYYYPAYKLAYLEWQGFTRSSDYRETLDVVLQLAKKEGVTNWIGNSKKMKAIRPADQDYTNNVWLPQLIECKVEKSATIVSDDIFNRMAVASMEKKAEDTVKEMDFERRFFNDPQEALEWITGKPGITFNDLQ